MTSHQTGCVSPTLAVPLEPLAHLQDVASSSLFYRYYVGRCSNKLTELLPLHHCRGSFTPLLIGCVIFLSPFVDVRRM